MLLALRAGNKDLLTVLIENGADINTPARDVRKKFRTNKIISWNIAQLNILVTILLCLYIICFVCNHIREILL